MTSSPNIDVQDIDHLGIIAGVVDEIGIVEIINQLIGTHEQEQVSAGHIVRAMILNCMGFLTSPLYLFSQFFEGKATEHLLGSGILPKHLNDSRIGRVLDKLYRHGVTQIFTEVAMTVVKKFGISLKCAHLDATSLSVEGQYKDKPHSPDSPEAEENKELEETNPEEEPIPIKITHGYSRDHRPDLKQFVVNLITSGDGDIPLLMQVGNGNDADKAVFPQVMQALTQQWQPMRFQALIADAAFYSAENLQAVQTIHWISHVPSQLNDAKNLLQGLYPEQFQASVLEGYRFTEVCSTYAGIPQRWLVVESQKRQEADLKQLEQRIEKEFKQQTQALKKLSTETFACEADTLAAARRFAKDLKYHELAELGTRSLPHYAKAGRPAKGEIPTHFSYTIAAKLTADESAIEVYRRQAGRFILATNLLEETLWSNEDILREYKNQQSCERGFRFLKDPIFFASSVFLKTPGRIVALVMIMVLCLMVYSLGQRQLRGALERAGATVANQKGKPTARPTMRWILQCFQSVHLVWMEGCQSLIKLNERQQLILPFLGAACQKYYFLG